MTKITQIPTLQDIERVHDTIKPFINRTPVLHAEEINAMAGCEIFFKCENFQKVGAFKMRGAASAVAALTKEERQRGIATHSSGNHAQAVALSGKQYGIPAHIVMPQNAPKVKRQRVKEYGGIIYTSGNRITDREAMLDKVIEATNANFIHPYDNYDVIAGQASASKELLEEVDNLNIIIAPIGGGGMMSGTALYTHYTQPHIKVLGSEPEIVNDAFRGMQSGQIEYNDRIDTIADGLRTPLSKKTFEIIQKHVQDIITVSEEEIVAAMRIIWERLKIIIEPSCAVPFAAILQQKERFKNQRIGVIITGGNVDLENLPF